MISWLVCSMTILCLLPPIRALDLEQLPVAENVELIHMDAPSIFIPHSNSTIPVPILVPVVVAEYSPDRPFLDYTLVIRKILYGTIAFLVAVIIVIVSVSTL